ncbi:vWA domain-containing protein [Streptomyces morookaense]|uniref:VWFA domain-containing protein n=1 Tax=Streptomyces morookaense TaxID=1970 RepID=A0A7Y7E6H4_STRMO|nr:hypothetical protein [Streptomyces morookaense]NVK77294.1 hypothetical protein [Streptomyces morookaense]GHF18127.1 hypothetical protein GCM10010359_19750 [Streptomyces morookaense]
MTSVLPLILGVEPVPRSQWGPVRARNRNVAVVYATAAGELDLAGSTTLTWKDKILGKYLTRFEVSVGDHRRKAQLVTSPLTCSDGSHRFDATLDLGFRVHDPLEIVRRNVTDALPVVYSHLIPRLRAEARRFGIEDAAGAEDHLNRLFAHGISLPEGITIYHCSVVIEPDEAARSHIAALTTARRQAAIARGAHEAQVAAARTDQALLDIQQDGELARQAQRKAALGNMSVDLEGVLKQHLVMHPEDTAQVAELLARAEAEHTARTDLQAQRWDQMFRFMVEKDMIRPADLPMLGGTVPAGLQALAPKQLADPPGLPSTAAPMPTAPQPPKPVIWGGLAAQHGNPSGGAPDAPVRQLPVYLLIDTSADAQPFMDGLNAALYDLHSALIADQDASAGIRLAALAFNEQSHVLTQLSPVASVDHLTRLTASGRARYSAAFDGLTALLSADVDALKTSGHRVQRPVAFFLGTSGPSDDTAVWGSARDRLAGHRYAPTVIACGLGSTTPSAVLRIAEQPEIAFRGKSNASVADQVRGFSRLLCNTVLGLGRGLRFGGWDLVVECPAGLLPASPTHN